MKSDDLIYSEANDESISANYTRRPFTFALITFLVSAVVATAVIWRSEQDRIHIARSEAAGLAGDHANMLEITIARALSATHALSFLVRQGNGTVGDFDTIGRQMLDLYPGAANLQLAPDGIVKQIAPLAGNEKVIGLDQLNDPVRAKEAVLARDTGKLTLAGPFELMQGGLGAVGRLPVFLDGGAGDSVFWGFTVVLIRFPEVLEPADFKQMAKRGFNYELWRIHPDTGKKQVIAASSTTAPVDPVVISVNIPNGTWNLGVAPATGWGEPAALVLKTFFGLLLSLILAYLAKLMIDQKNHERGLEVTVARRTTELNREIAANKLADAAMRESEEQLRVIFETSESGIIVVSPEGIIDFANRRMAEMFGMTLHELIGTPYPDHLHESEIQVGDDRMRELIKGEIQLVTLDRRYIRGDGTDFWGHLSGRRLENPDGSLRGLVGVIADITERKMAEDELQKSKMRYEALFTRASDGIFILSIDGKLIEVNESFARMHGYSPQEMLQMKLQDLDTPESFRSAPERMRRLSAGESLTFEVEHYHKDGHVFPLEVSASLISSGGESYIQCFHRDISERKQAEEERRQLEEQFHHAQKLESLGVLTGGIAHDFNNILTVILGYCYMGRRDLNSEQEYRAAFQHIETAGNRAADLCRQMLTYAGRTESVQTRLGLCLLVDEVVKMLQSTIKKNVTIELDLGRDLPEIMGDTSQIQQIVMNLIINAAEAIGDANGTIKVVLTKTIIPIEQRFTDVFGTIVHAGSYLYLEVTDTGSGMDKETHKRIFEPFYTTKFTGRGLGMSAIRGIIKAHDAALQLISKPDVGTTFKVYFPHLAASLVDASTALTAPPLTEKAGGTILLVDDEHILREMGETMLEAMGFTAITASNGGEALEIYRERGNGIDLILLDLVMPVMGGLEAYHELRKISHTVPILICSGYSIESVNGTTDNDDHAGFMHKPYKPGELRDAIVKMLK
jgi:two-component system cell cycle sensor histidine kinase/response regulator CckA